MCVDGCTTKALTRGEVLASIAGASLFAFGHANAQAAALPKRAEVGLPALPPYSNANAAAAARIAKNSRLITSASRDVVALAQSLQRPKTGSNVRALLHDPVPMYAKRLTDPAARAALRASLLQAHFIDGPEAIDAFLPADGRPMTVAPQPFWVTAGSGQNSHHAYPGGLVMHELFNARAAIALAHNYDVAYFGGRKTIDRDVVTAAALYHDIMKTVVFQWNPDGTLSVEPNIAGTGAHHVLSGAEAIVRGEDAPFVLVLLSAHAAPSLGDEAKVADWARAACMVAGVDPLDYGILKKAGGAYELAMLPPVEAFINNLSDHDYVLSVHAMHEVAPLVDAHIAAAGVAQPQVLWHRNALLANAGAIGLYQTLARDRRAFARELERHLSEVRF